jgi:acyl-CoA thioesterase
MTADDGDGGERGTDERGTDGAGDDATPPGATGDPDADDRLASIRARASDDPFCATVGIELDAVGEGYAETSLVVGEEHLNFHGTPHGGAVYSLADAAFAAASNTGEATAVALETNISYFAAVEVGERLRATAEETHRGGRTAAYEVRVVDGGGDPVAAFRGRVYRLDPEG